MLRRSTRRTTGSFYFQTLPPVELDADEVQAILDAGVLTLRLPKPAQRRRITIGVRLARVVATPSLP